MAFRPTKCSSCGKDVQVPDDLDVAVCMYCGGSIVVRDAIQINIGANTANLLALARTASVAGNNSEAYNYYNRVLEGDPTNVLAWFGKGEAAGWMSNLNAFRFSELLVAVENALRFCAENEREQLKLKIAQALNSIATACYSISQKHLIEFVALNNSWVEYLTRCSEIISLYEIAHTYAPRDRTIIENIIHLCKDNIEGVKYNDPYDNNASKLHGISEKYSNEMRARISKYGVILRGIDPTYVIPNPKPQSNSACFIITATMGDADHPAVTLLRSFRDEVLAKFSFGKAFVSWYYKNGPLVARRIENSILARILSLVLIVVPAALVAAAAVQAARGIARLASWRRSKRSA